MKAELMFVSSHSHQEPSSAILNVLELLGAPAGINPVGKIFSCHRSIHRFAFSSSNMLSESCFCSWQFVLL